MQDLIRIGTRKSRLALVQTNIVRQKIEEAFPGIRVEICEMSTKGDELLLPRCRTGSPAPRRGRAPGRACGPRPEIFPHCAGTPRWKQGGRHI